MTDAFEAVGVCKRQGAGKQKHFTIKQLWAQGQEERGELTIGKVPRELNVADLYIFIYIYIYIYIYTYKYILITDQRRRSISV